MLQLWDSVVGTISFILSTLRSYASDWSRHHILSMKDRGALVLSRVYTLTESIHTSLVTCIALKIGALENGIISYIDEPHHILR